MSTNERDKALLEVIRQGLEVSGIQNTEKMLGNRINYIGLSDLARYAECPRAALAAKIFPAKNSLAHLLVLQRGHWFENGLRECLESLALKFIPQLEISVTHQEIPIRGHLDFTLVWNKPYPAIRIIESKSINKLPDEAYKSHLFQAQAQVNLLRKFWKEPVFTVKNDTGGILAKNLCFPEICKKILAMDIPKIPKTFPWKAGFYACQWKMRFLLVHMYMKKKNSKRCFYWPSLSGTCTAFYGMTRWN